MKESDEANRTNQIEQASRLLLDGQLIGLPTETVYGLAARGDKIFAIDGIFSVKGRPRTNPLILHVAETNDARTLFAKDLDSIVTRRFERLATLWPGPLTLVGPKSDDVLDAVTAGGDTVAIRIPDHPLALAVMRKLRQLAGKVVPVAAPSANLSNYISPTTAQHVRDGLGDQIAMVVDGGPCRVGVESTIVYLGNANEPPRILRSGSFDSMTIQGCLKETLATPNSQSGIETTVASPGQFPKHYSPCKPLSLLQPNNLPPVDSDTLRIVFNPTEVDRENVWSLSPDGNLEHAAANLYSMLRRADDSGYARIEIVACEETGIGIALLDRLRRAACSS